MFLDAITTNETYFFRDMQHYQWLGGRIPPRASPAGPAAQKRPRRLRIWSAACSTGEEPYSMAIEILEKRPMLRRLEPPDPRHRPERRRAGRGPRRPLRRPRRPPRRARTAARLLRRGHRRRDLDRQARRQGDGHLEAAQPALPAGRRAVRLHFHQECADLFRQGLQAGRGQEPGRGPGRRRVPRRRADRGHLQHAGSARSA